MKGGGKKNILNVAHLVTKSCGEKRQKNHYKNCNA